VAALGADGARFVALREVPFDRDGEVSWDSIIRRYNSELANDFGNLVNRAVTMAQRSFPDAAPPPRAAAASPLGAAWVATRMRASDAMDQVALHEWLGVLWELVGTANRFVDSEKPWELAKAAKDGDAAAREQLSGVLGDLLETCRLVALYAAPAIPRVAAQIWELLGHRWPYDEDGHGGPALQELGEWGACVADRPLSSPVPLFPRLERDEQSPATR
jgi:methionyl-tRNA synthetase